MRLFANKKGFLDNATDLLVITLLLVIGMIMISFFLFTASGDQNQTSVIHAQGELIEQELVNFLNLPVEIDEQTILVSDLVISAANTQEVLNLELLFREYFVDKQQTAQLEVYDEETFNIQGATLYKLNTVVSKPSIIQNEDRYRPEEQFNFRDAHSLTILAKSKSENLIVVLYVK